MQVVRFEAVGGEPDDGPLTGAERARRDRLREPADRASYVAAHVLVRRCAAELLGVAVETVVVAQTCPDCGRDGHGPPRVVDAPEVRLSLSHARGVVAAVAAYGACGIDVEPVPDRPLPAAALTPGETAWLAGRPDALRAAGELWTRKEALVKAGAGRLDDLATLGVATPSDGLLDVVATRHGPLAVAGWAQEGYVGAWALSPPSSWGSGGRGRRRGRPGPGPGAGRRG